MHSALTQMVVIPVFVNLGILEMESLVQVSNIHGQWSHLYRLVIYMVNFKSTAPPPQDFI